MARHVAILIPNLVLALGVLVDLVSLDTCLKVLMVLLIVGHGVFLFQDSRDKERERGRMHNPIRDLRERREAEQAQAQYDHAQKVIKAGLSTEDDLAVDGDEVTLSIPGKKKSAEIRRKIDKIS